MRFSLAPALRTVLLLSISSLHAADLLKCSNDLEILIKVPKSQGGQGAQGVPSEQVELLLTQIKNVSGTTPPDWVQLSHSLYAGTKDLEEYGKHLIAGRDTTLELAAIGKAEDYLRMALPPGLNNDTSPLLSKMLKDFDTALKAYEEVHRQLVEASHQFYAKAFQEPLPEQEMYLLLKNLQATDLVPNDQMTHFLIDFMVRLFRGSPDLIETYRRQDIFHTMFDILRRRPRPSVGHLLQERFLALHSPLAPENRAFMDLYSVWTRPHFFPDLFDRNPIPEFSPAQIKEYFLTIKDDAYRLSKFRMEHPEEDIVELTLERAGATRDLELARSAIQFMRTWDYRSIPATLGPQLKKVLLREDELLRVAPATDPFDRSDQEFFADLWFKFFGDEAVEIYRDRFDSAHPQMKEVIVSWLYSMAHSQADQTMWVEVFSIIEKSLQSNDAGKIKAVFPLFTDILVDSKTPQAWKEDLIALKPLLSWIDFNIFVKDNLLEELGHVLKYLNDSEAGSPLP